MDAREILRRVGDVATRGRRAVVQARLWDMVENATGEERSALRLAADVLQVLDQAEAAATGLETLAARAGLTVPEYAERALREHVQAELASIERCGG